MSCTTRYPIQSREEPDGFTLIEMLVVIAVIALLISLVAPAVAGALDRAKRIKCLSNMRQLGQALVTYASLTDEIPAVRDSPGGTSSTLWFEEEYLGPYIGSPKLGARDPTGSYRIPPPGSLLECPVRSVGDFGRPYASWIGLNNQASKRWFVDTPAEYAATRFDPGIYSAIDKPLSKVVAFADSSGYGLTYLSNYVQNDGSQFVGLNPFSGFNPRHDGGANYAFMDGHARYFRDPDQAFFDKHMYLVPTTIWDKDLKR